MEFNAPPVETTKGMASMDKIEPPKKTFFFQRYDGSIFFTGEEEAWAIYRGRNQTVGQRNPIPKLIGTSDGKITMQAIIEAKDIFQKEGLTKAQEHIRIAQAKELEIAKLTIVPPRNFDTIGNNGQPVNISDLK